MCRVFKKRLTTVRKMGDYESPCWYDDQVSFMPTELDSPRRISSHPYTSYSHHHHHYACKQELELQFNMPPDPFLQLPQLESPKVPQSAGSVSCNSVVVPSYGFDKNNINNGSTTMQSSTLTQEEQVQQNMNSIYNDHAVDQVTDWRVLDKFVASQLSHDDQDHAAPKDNNYSLNSSSTVFHHHVGEQMNLLANNIESKRPDIGHEYASNSTSTSCQIDLWK